MLTAQHAGDRTLTHEQSHEQACDDPPRHRMQPPDSQKSAPCLDGSESARSAAPCAYCSESALSAAHTPVYTVVPVYAPVPGKSEICASTTRLTMPRAPSAPTIKSAWTISPERSETEGRDPECAVWADGGETPATAQSKDIWVPAEIECVHSMSHRSRCGGGSPP